MTNKQRRHAEVIKAWADGAEIEYRNTSGKWAPADYPAFVDDYEYRVKPARSYPHVPIEAGPISDALRKLVCFPGSASAQCFVDTVISHAMDTGQVVTREEFALAIGDRDKRDWAVAQAVMNACKGDYGVIGFAFQTPDLAAIVAKVSNV